MKRYLRATTPEGLVPLEGGGWDGVAFGAEFCHGRLPAPSQVRSVAALCRKRGLAFTLVTPLVREGALGRVCRWLEAVAPALAGGECVFSDWGLLLWARGRGLDLRPSLGRLLSRQRRDPRSVALCAGAGPEEADALRGSLWDDDVSCRLLAEYGVNRVELDWLLQGVRRPSLPEGVGLTLCGPWLPVTVAPSCPWAENALRCSRPCRKHPTALLENDEDPAPLWSRGNVLFTQGPPLPSGKALAALGCDRVAWAEELPG